MTLCCIDGACVCGDVGTDLPKDLFVLAEIVGLVVVLAVPTERLLLLAGTLVPMLVLLLVAEMLGLVLLRLIDVLSMDGALVAESVLDLLGRDTAVAAGDVDVGADRVAVAEGADRVGADLAAESPLRPAEPDDLLASAKQGNKRRPKINPPSIILFFISFKANMINLLSAAELLWPPSQPQNYDC